MSASDETRDGLDDGDSDELQAWLDSQFPATREEWLTARIPELAGMLLEAGAPPLPERIRVACGWPTGRTDKTLGECWNAKASGNGTVEIFITPALQDPGAVLSVLLHELIHAAVGTEKGHKRAFGDVARRLGFQRPWSLTPPSQELIARLNAIAALAPEYPHAALEIPKRKKQSTRLLKAECPDCGYVIRLTMKWAVLGLPSCFCRGAIFQVVDADAKAA